jgi:hypothetical protein
MQGNILSMGGAALSASLPTLVKSPVHTILDEAQISSSVELCFGP